MSSWVTLVVLGGVAWLVVSLLLSLLLGRVLRLSDLAAKDRTSEPARLEADLPTAAPDLPLARPIAAERSVSEAHAAAAVRTSLPAEQAGLRVLVVDDDPPLRLLLRTTLGTGTFSVRDVPSAEAAAEVVRLWSPAVVLLDIGLPGADGLTFCRELKDRARPPFVILLTGSEVTADAAAQAGADAVLRKPFSPVELITLLNGVRTTHSGAPPAPDLHEAAPQSAEQLLVYARDLGRLVDAEHDQRQLLRNAYRETATALADALEAKDPRTGLHALRVQQYAIELTAAVDDRLLDDETLEYGYLLHDVGKLGIPDAILQKVGPLNEAEHLVMQQHTVGGARILSRIPYLSGAAVDVVRSHHERWDGAGYPHGLRETDISLGARIFAVVDTLDAMTSDRPYRRALPWSSAVEEIRAQARRQFDPGVVAAFEATERRLRRIAEELTERVA